VSAAEERSPSGSGTAGSGTAGSATAGSGTARRWSDHRRAVSVVLLRCRCPTTAGN